MKSICVRKRDGRIVAWDTKRVERAIALAFYNVANGDQPNPYRDSPEECYGINRAVFDTRVVDMARRVERAVRNRYKVSEPSIEDVQNTVEIIIASEGEWEVVKSYIVYRSRKAEVRLRHYAVNGLQDFIAVDKYSRYRPDLSRRETWREAVARVTDMHARRWPKLRSEIEALFQGVAERRYLPSMRSLQFGGAAIETAEARQYNCSFSFADRPRFFAEAFYLLLCGCGVGFSVQHRHVSKLPPFPMRGVEDDLKVVHHTVADTIEGWSDALMALVQSYYDRTRIEFNFSLIRPRGAPIKTGGGKAPGHLPLMRSLEAIRGVLSQASDRRLRPIEVYDIVMHISSAVLSGGVRRSATICLFSPDDDEMRLAKTGNWYKTNPQRAYSNNSAVLLRGSSTREQFQALFKAAKEFGDPGFFWTDNPDYGANPCVEIGLCPKVTVTPADVKALAHYGVNAELGQDLSGWQMCNLTTVNGALADTEEKFYAACRGASYIGTLQAAYTHIPYLGPVTQYINDREALIGVSICGIMDNPAILLNPDILGKGAEIVKAVNAEVAARIGIRPAARTTCVKPEGTASLLLGAASGIHPHHARRYFRRVFVNRSDPVYTHFKLYNQTMTEPSQGNPARDDVIVFPVEAPAGAITRDKIDAIDFLETVRRVQHSWVLPGTRDSSLHPGLSHNVSNTVNVREGEWDQVEALIWDHRADFTGVALIPYSGDKVYAQTPYEEVTTAGDVARWNALNCSEVDYSTMYEAGDNTKLVQSLACAGGKCDL